MNSKDYPENTDMYWAGGVGIYVYAYPEILKKRPRIRKRARGMMICGNV